MARLSYQHLLNIEWLDIEQVKPYYRNSRKNKDTIPIVVESIKNYGWQQPIVIDKNCTIVAGHSRYNAARELKLAQVPVVYFEGTQTQAREYRLLDNRSQENSLWDYDLLKNELYDLDLPTGFSENEIDKILNEKTKGKVVYADPTVFEIVVYCEDEQQQKDIYDYVNNQLGKVCRVLTI